MNDFCQLIKSSSPVRKKNKQHTTAFTLIEVIVVAVIVAVLAAVAIPLYAGYVNNSRQNIVDNTAGALATFAAASRDQGNVVSGPKTGGQKYDGAKNTTWQVPTQCNADITGNVAKITHTKGGQTASQNF